MSVVCGELHLSRVTDGSFSSCCLMVGLVGIVVRDSLPDNDKYCDGNRHGVSLTGVCRILGKPSSVSWISMVYSKDMFAAKGQ